MPRMAKWQVEMPWLSFGTYNSPLYGISNPNQRLLQLWMERSCQMMVIDPNNNPMSFPIIEHLKQSPSLVHALQSVSAGYEGYFKDKTLALCLEERQRALVALRDELKDANQQTPSVFLTIFMLGMTTSWIDSDISVFGRDHLSGARSVIDSIVENAMTCPEPDPALQFIVGSYIYWDMCCAFVAEPSELQPLNKPQIYQYIQSMRSIYHPICGFSVELFYLLGNLGRYCRKVLDGMVPDLFIEAAFEEQLLGYSGPVDNHLLKLTNECFCNHGLIMLYRICGRLRVPSDFQPEITDDTVSNADLDTEFDCSNITEISNIDTDELIQNLALEIVDKLSEIPLSSLNMNILALPMLSAGSELGPDHHEARKECRTRMVSLYSRNRCPPNLWACQLLDDLWDVRDSTGSKLSWLELALRNGWRFSLA